MSKRNTRGTQAWEVPVWLIDQALHRVARLNPHALHPGCGKETLRYWFYYSGDEWALGMSRNQMRKLMVKAEEHCIIRRVTQPPAIARYEVHETIA